LFTLVGIAGEDISRCTRSSDTKPKSSARPGAPDPGGSMGKHKGSQKGCNAPERRSNVPARLAQVPLRPRVEASAALCDGLVAELTRSPN